MTLKEIFKDIWENSPCRCPLALAQWDWRTTWEGRILHCLNDDSWWGR